MTTNVMFAAAGMSTPVLVIVGFIVLGLMLFGPLVLGAVLIQERQVGIVVKRFGRRGLAPGRLIALGGEAGYQADTLAPGLHFGYWRWQYRIIKEPVTVVPQGEIALVLAADGAAIPAERILGKIVDCDNFQDARKFLVNKLFPQLGAGLHRARLFEGARPTANRSRRATFVRPSVPTTCRRLTRSSATSIRPRN